MCAIFAHVGWRYGVGGGKPSTPTLSVSLLSTTATASITGDVGVTNYLVYKKSTETNWTDGGSRAGDGTIEVADLEIGVTYIFMAYSDNGILSIGTAVTVSLGSSPAAANGIYDVARIDIFPIALVTHGEDVIYYPAGGSARPIRAIVKRIQSTSGVELLADVANDSTTGISSSEINVGKDKIELAVRLGNAVQQRRITEIKHQCASSLKLEIA
jgi:hypothetical protein